MDIPFYHIDAFTSRVFSGNPAGVCFLQSWLDQAILQSIAAENNLPETAFLVRSADYYELRWFTPTVEVDLCGHATLASAHAHFSYIDSSGTRIRFHTKSGSLTVQRQEKRLIMDFPATEPSDCPWPSGIVDILGQQPSQVLRSRDLLVIFDSEQQIKGLKPDLARLSTLDCFAVTVTAPGEQCDYVSRFFAPRQGIPEDPATGSAQCTLIPYWSRRLEKSKLHALQLSGRGGEFYCEHRGQRVAIAGRAVTFLSGTISI